MMQSNTSNELFPIALGHLQAGRWHDAERIYRQILSAEPDNSDAVHMLGITVGQLGRHPDAVRLIQRAIELRPHFPAAWYNLGNSLRDSGRADDAISAYQKAILQNPVYQKAILNLGVLLAGLGKEDEAIALYRQATARTPPFPEAYYNLANVLQEKGDLASAIECYRTAIAQRPNYADAYRNMGSALGTLGRMDDAVQAFTKAIVFNPQLIGAYVNLSTALRYQRRFEDAVKVCRQAIALHPDSALNYCELGNALRDQGAWDPAAKAYRNAIALDGSLSVAHAGLSQALEKQGDLAGAINELKSARDRAESPESVDYVLAALSSGQAPPQPPTEFIVSLFDEYADHFDSSLAALEYQGPQLLFDAVNASNVAPPFDILDLGCGTGQCGTLFRPIARELTGIDLSPRMIEQARLRGVYDYLRQQEVTTALKQDAGRYDLILAADVFIYVGKLEGIFESAANALRPGGLFAFTIENTTDGDYVLRNSRRYAQSVEYIQRLATQFGFKIVSIHDAEIRTENQQPVAGNVVMLSGVQ